MEQKFKSVSIIISVFYYIIIYHHQHQIFLLHPGGSIQQWHYTNDYVKGNEFNTYYKKHKILLFCKYLLVETNHLAFCFNQEQFSFEFYLHVLYFDLERSDLELKALIWNYRKTLKPKSTWTFISLFQIFTLIFSRES